MALLLKSVGMTTPVGLVARPACAAIRAGITRIGELDHLYDRTGEPLLGATVPNIESLDAEERVAELMLRSIRDAFDSLTGSRPTRIHLAICLDDRPRRTSRRSIVDAILATIHELIGPVPHSIEILAEGNAGGLLALARYEERLRHDSHCTAVIVGADSLPNRSAIEYFERDERLRDARQVRGLCVGEAGACLIVDGAARTASGPTLARIHGISVSEEPVRPGDDEGFFGHGLTRALRNTLSTPPPPSHVFCDQNGELYRGHEWALASIRAFEGATLPKVVHPAENIGDVGAAFGPLLVGLAAILQNPVVARPYAERYDPALIYCSSDSGARAAAIVTRIDRQMRAVP